MACLNVTSAKTSWMEEHALKTTGEKKRGGRDMKMHGCEWHLSESYLNNYGKIRKRIFNNLIKINSQGCENQHFYKQFLWFLFQVQIWNMHNQEDLLFTEWSIFQALNPDKIAGCTYKLMLWHRNVTLAKISALNKNQVFINELRIEMENISNEKHTIYLSTISL